MAESCWLYEKRERPEDTHVHTNAHTCMHTCICTCARMCAHMCTCMHVCALIHISTHADARMCTHVSNMYVHTSGHIYA
jgi:hypothetical protein